MDTLERKAISEAEQLFDAEQGKSLYRLLMARWFKEGVQARIDGKSIDTLWNIHQRNGYNSMVTVQFAVAEMAVQP